MTGAAPASGGRQTGANAEPPVSAMVDKQPQETQARVEGAVGASAPRATVPTTRQTRQAAPAAGRRRVHETTVVGNPTVAGTTPSATPSVGTPSVDIPSAGTTPAAPPTTLPNPQSTPTSGVSPTHEVPRPDAPDAGAMTVSDSVGLSTAATREDRHLETPTLTRMNLSEALTSTGRAQPRARTATAEGDAPASVEPSAVPRSKPSTATTGAGLYLLIKEVVVVVTLALVLALVAKTWVMQTFEIPSDSMLTTLQKKDRVTVSKVMVGPLDINRGDIVVFEDPARWLRGVDKTEKHQGPLGEAFGAVMTWIGLMPNDAGNHVIKRVIGMPGDKVECCDDKGRLLVNGTPIDEPYVYPGKKPSEERFSVVVPAGKIWVMGDNRNNSLDSRYNDMRFQHEGVTHSNGQRLSGNQKPEGYQTDPQDGTGYFGSVPLKNVVGKAVVMVWPLNRLGILSGAASTFATVPPPDPTAVPGPIPGVSKASSAPPTPSPSPTVTQEETPSTPPEETETPADSQ